MKVKELKKLLDNYDGDLDIGFIASWTDHQCRDYECCYCSDEEHTYDITGIEREIKPSDKLKKIKKLYISGERSYEE